MSGSLIKLRNEEVKELVFQKIFYGELRLQHTRLKEHIWMTERVSGSGIISVMKRDELSLARMLIFPAITIIT